VFWSNGGGDDDERASERNDQGVIAFSSPFARHFGPIPATVSRACYVSRDRRNVLTFVRLWRVGALGGGGGRPDACDEDSSLSMSSPLSLLPPSLINTRANTPTLHAVSRVRSIRQPIAGARIPVAVRPTHTEAHAPNLPSDRKTRTGEKSAPQSKRRERGEEQTQTKPAKKALAMQRKCGSGAP
jgi:hypothetical protein